MDLALEDHGLAGQLGGVDLGGRRIHKKLIAGGQAHQSLFKAGDEGVRAQLQAVAFGLAALKGHAVVEALEVQDHGVAFLGGALHGLDAAVALGHAVDFGLDLFIGHIDFGLGNLQALVIAQGHFGVEIGLHREDNAAILAVFQVGDVGRADGLDLLGHDGLFIDLGENLVDSVFIEHLGAVHTLDHLPGGLALAEAGDKDIFAALVVGLGQSGVKLRLLHFDDDFGLSGGFLGVFHIHGCCSSYVVGHCWP